MKNDIIKEDIETVLNEPLPWETLRGKTVLVTGASGFIGSYIVETLLALRYVKVLALVRNEKKANEKFMHHLDNPSFKIMVQDVSEPFDLEENVDIIIHAASQASPKYYGKDPVGTLKANTLGTYHLLELGVKHNVDKFLFFSTCEVYGLIDENVKQIDESYTGAFDPTDVRSCYGESKRMGENMCVCYSQQYGLKTVIVRPAHTYGPGLSLDDGRVFCDFIKNAFCGDDIILNSDGKSSRKFLYISDFIRAMFVVLFKSNDKEAYNITADKEISILELAKLIIALCPEKNLNVKFAQDVFQDGYMKSASTKADFVSDKIKKLGWKAKISETKGFQRMIDFYRNK